MIEIEQHKKNVLFNKSNQFIEKVYGSFLDLVAIPFYSNYDSFIGF